jgi:hypothetical protein
MLPAHSRPRHHHLPRMQERAGGEHLNVHGLSTLFPPPPFVRQIEPEVDVRGVSNCPHLYLPDVGQPPTEGITSQYCTAMSFDTRNAIARFIDWF